MKKRIWMFSGKQGVGKTTYANTIKEYFQPHCKIIKFADPLYELHDACLPLLKTFGVRSDEMKKDGDLLQILGTEYGRKKLGEDVWVRCFTKKVNDYLATDERNIVVNDDCRFVNEFESFHNDAHMVRLIAPESVRMERCSYWRDSVDHASETALDEYERKQMFHACVNTELATPQDTLNELLTTWGYMDIGK